MQDYIAHVAPHGLLHLPFYSIQNHQPSDGTTYSELGIPTPIVNQDNTSQADQPDGCVSSTEDSFSQMTLPYITST